ncbi:hypothetical protein AWENTII_009021 [Aspergillus wentii]
MTAHPYYPPGVAIDGYLPNGWNTLALLSIFSAVCVAIFAVTSLIIGKANHRISNSDRWTVLWFVLSGCIHLVLEGHYVYSFKPLGSDQTLLGQLWKEYALSDSRYLTQDAFVLCMETITAVCWGPLSFLLAILIAIDHPLRHSVQTVVSLGQLYGDVLYFATSMFDHVILGLSYSRPEGYYFWGYFVFLNAFWIFIPLSE